MKTLKHLVSEHSSNFEFSIPSTRRLVASCKLHATPHRRVWEFDEWNEAVSKVIDEELKSHASSET